MNIMDNEKLFILSAVIMIAVLLIRTPFMIRPRHFRYAYSAKTDNKKEDHAYEFEIRLLRDGSYRCYILRAPFLFGKRFTRYAINFEDETDTGNRFIFCNRTINRLEDAKKLCAEWSDVNQHYVDNCRYREY